MGKKRTFKFQDAIYDIPEEEVEGFLSRKPKAIEVESYTVGKDTFDVPLDEVPGFLSRKPDAKPLNQEQEQDTIPPATPIIITREDSFGKPEEDPVLPTVSLDKEGNISPNVEVPRKTRDAIVGSLMNVPENQLNNPVFAKTFTNEYARRTGTDPRAVKKILDQGIKDYNEYITLKASYDTNPNNTDALYRLGELLNRMGQYDKAAEAYTALQGKLEKIGEAEFADPNNQNKRPDYIAQRVLPALQGLAYTEYLRGNQNESQRLQGMVESLGGNTSGMPSVGEGSYNQPQQTPSTYGFTGKRGDDSTPTPASKYLNDISDAIGRSTNIKPMMEMVTHGEEKLASAFTKPGSISDVQLRFLTGLAETVAGVAGVTTPEGAVFGLPFMQAQNMVPEETAAWMMPVNKVIDDYYKERGEEVPESMQNLATLGSFAVLAAAHGLAKTGSETIKAEVQGRKIASAIDKGVQEYANQNEYVEAVLNNMSESERNNLVSDIEKRVNEGGIEALTQDAYKVAEQTKELKQDAKIVEEFNAEPEPYTPEKVPGSLAEVKEGTPVTMNGTEGIIERGDDGTWYFTTDEGKSTQIKVEDKFNPVEPLKDLGIEVLPEVPAQDMARAMADAEQIGWVENKGKKYFVSLDRPGRENATGDVVYEQRSDGTLVNRFDSHPDPTFAANRKLSIINKFLAEKGLPPREKLVEGVIEVKEPTATIEQPEVVIEQPEATPEKPTATIEENTTPVSAEQAPEGAVTPEGAEVVEGEAYTAENKGAKSKRIYLADKEVADALQEDGSIVQKYKYKIDNPLVVKTDSDFNIIKSIIDDYYKENPNAKFHPDVTEHVNNIIEKKGYDGIIIKESALESEKGYNDIGGTYGEPQIIVFDRKNVTKAEGAPREVQQTPPKEKVTRNSVLDLRDQYNAMPKGERSLELREKLNAQAKEMGFDVVNDKGGKVKIIQKDGKGVNRSPVKLTPEQRAEAKAKSEQVKKAKTMPAVDLRQLILQHFLGGGKSVKLADAMHNTGLNAKNFAEFTVGEKGISIHDLWESWKTDPDVAHLIPENDLDFANQFFDVLTEYGDKKQMWKDLLSYADDATWKDMGFQSKEAYENALFSRMEAAKEGVDINDITEDHYAQAEAEVAAMSDEAVEAMLADLDNNSPKTIEELNTFYEEHGIDPSTEEGIAESKTGGTKGEDLGEIRKQVIKEEKESAKAKEIVDAEKEYNEAKAEYDKLRSEVDERIMAEQQQEVFASKETNPLEGDFDATQRDKVLQDAKARYEKARDRINEVQGLRVTSEEAMQQRRNMSNIANNNIGINISMPTDILKKMKQIGTKYFTVRGGMPKNAFRFMTEMQGGKAATVTEVLYRVRELKDAIKNEYGVGFNKLPASEILKMDEYLKGNTGVNIPTDVALALNKMREQIDSLSRDLIDNGIAEGDLAVTIDQNKGVYVTRAYRKFDDPSWAEKVPETVRNQAKAWVRQEYPTATPAEVDGLINHLLYEEGSPIQLLSGGKIGSKDFNIFKKRKDIPFELRQLFGEYNDPAINYARSVFKMSALIEHSKFLNNVYADGIGKYFFEKPTGEYFVKIASDTNKAYNPLSGLYTTKEIADTFNNLKSSLKNDDLWSKVMRAYMTVNTAVKTGKTVGSPQTHVRNVLSNLTFVVANGHYLNPEGFKKTWEVVRSEWKEKSDQALLEYIQDLKREGVLDENTMAGEMKDMIKDASNRYDDTTDLLNDGIVSKIKNTAIKAYQLEDAVFKVFAFEAEKARYEKIGLSPQDAKIIAAENVRNTYPTYSLVPRIVKELRKAPIVGTFVSFPAEVIRTYGNTWALAVREIRDPATRKIGLTRMTGLIIATIGIKAAAEYSAIQFGVTDKEEQALRKMQPPWSRNADYLYVARDADGVPVYVDLGYSDPYNYLKKPINALMSDQDQNAAIAESMKEIFEPFLGYEMLYQKLMEIQTNQKQTGGKVYNEQLPLGDKMQLAYQHLSEALEPGAITSARRIYKGYKGESSPSGKQYNLEDEMIALTTGQRINRTNVKSAFGYQSFNFDRNMQEAKRIYNSALSQSQDPIKHQIAKEQATTAQRKVYEELRSNYNAAIQLRQKPSDLDALMKKSGISSRLRTAIMANQPYTPEFMETAPKKGHTSRGGRR